jgi:serine/threonine protein kinase
MSDSHEPAGFVAPEPADLAPLFPGYDIQGLIATGGMGAVYRAVQKSLDRTVALKILPMEFSKDAAFCAGFEAEAKAMARLNHPNLIGVFDFGEVNGMLFIIMEFVPGQSVYHSAYGIAVDQMEVIRLVSGICNGLAHAHENGIIHRDIKPSNVLLDLNAQPKIGDFGLARPMDRKIEEGEEIFGTPHYTAPEVVDNPHGVDYRADIFSVGVMLHELLTGKLPAQDPRPASAISRCDSRFDNIVKKATRPLPAARYSSAAEITNELHGIAISLQQKALQVAPVAAPRRAAPPKKYGTGQNKSSDSSSLVMVVIAVVVAGGAYMYFSKPTPTKIAPTVVEEPVAPTKPVAEKSTSEHDVSPDPAVRPKPDASSNSTAFGSHEPGVIPSGDPGTASTGASPATETPVVGEPAVAPKSDVPAFLGRARKIMQDRIKPLMSGYRANLSANCADFTRAVGVPVRKQKLSGGSVSKGLDAALAAMKAAGGKLPVVMDESISSVPGMDAVIAEYRQREVGLDDTLQQGLAQQSATYILGLEKQIERLKLDKDEGAIALVQEEIDKTKESPKYFSDLMLGVDSAADQ